MKQCLKHIILAVALISGLGAAVPGRPAIAVEFFVSSAGNDENSGTYEQPFATLSRAQQALRQGKKIGPAIVWVRGGVYYLSEPLVFTAADSGTAQSSVVYQSWQNEKPIISGGRKLNLKWEPYRAGIMKAQVPEGLVTDQLFINGKPQVLARYPNADPDVAILKGYAADAISPERAARWSDPTGGYIHAMHPNLWGSLDYIITGKNAENHVTYQGGWQNNRSAAMHKEYRFVENIFEELDAPGEWFLDRKTSTLYFYPPADVDLKTALVESVCGQQLVEFNGSAESPVKFVTLRGFTFCHTARTFMETKEPLLRSDWTIHRGGAVFFNGAQDCSVVDCEFDQLGGNAVFVNDYNRQITIESCLIKDCGASGICFVGDPKAVRSPLFEYKQRQSYDQIDKTPGPQSANFPADCLVEDCLVTRIGLVEKQAAGVEISMAQDITVRHCSIYEVPRAGINIGDGCWGGNIIEFCDVFDTVRETGDHGSFNSWGRDRYWGLTQVPAGELAGLAMLDAVKPNIIRNNRWRCDHGWDIDLDDGSSNFEIVDNLCLNGGIKLREGFRRVCENNIMVNNSLHPHVWYPDSEDIFRHNIVFNAYKPVRVHQPWGKECDFNLLHEPNSVAATPGASLQILSGADKHSIESDAMFVDPANGDYRVKDGSPAYGLGFHNFPMDQFGVVSPRLKAVVRTPKLPVYGQPLPVSEQAGKKTNSLWLGAVIKNLEGEEYSAVGVPKGTAGVMMADVPSGSKAAGYNLQTGDFIKAVNDHPVRDVLDFMKTIIAVPSGQPIRLKLIHDQNELTVTIASRSPDDRPD